MAGGWRQAATRAKISEHLAQHFSGSATLPYVRLIARCRRSPATAIVCRRLAVLAALFSTSALSGWGALLLRKRGVLSQPGRRVGDASKVAGLWTLSTENEYLACIHATPAFAALLK